jgi:succinate dehydrogenase/fumarate reductase cytochrome b subunit
MSVYKLIYRNTVNTIRDYWFPPKLPIAPHLSIYVSQPGATSSIIHRITGFFTIIFPILFIVYYFHFNFDIILLDFYVYIGELYSEAIKEYGQIFKGHFPEFEYFEPRGTFKEETPVGRGIFVSFKSDVYIDYPFIKRRTTGLLWGIHDHSFFHYFDRLLINYFDKVYHYQADPLFMKGTEYDGYCPPYNRHYHDINALIADPDLEVKRGLAEACHYTLFNRFKDFRPYAALSTGLDVAFYRDYAVRTLPFYTDLLSIFDIKHLFNYYVPQLVYFISTTIEAFPEFLKFIEFNLAATIRDYTDKHVEFLHDSYLSPRIITDIVLDGTPYFQATFGFNMEKFYIMPYLYWDIFYGLLVKTALFIEFPTAYAYFLLASESCSLSIFRPDIFMRAAEQFTPNNDSAITSMYNMGFHISQCGYYKELSVPHFLFLLISHRILLWFNYFVDLLDIMIFESGGIYSEPYIMEPLIYKIIPFIVTLPFFGLFFALLYHLLHGMQHWRWDDFVTSSAYHSFLKGTQLKYVYLFFINIYFLSLLSSILRSDYVVLAYWFNFLMYTL